jgi:uncharacterized protein (DUF1330 family)
MPKGYWLPQIDVRNMDGYKAYMNATPPAHQKFNGVALVRGGKMEVVEGHARSRNVIREFPDYATALACYRSPEYQSARPLRLQNSECDFLIVEGFDGAQPVQTAAPPAGAGGKGYWIAHVEVTGPEDYGVYAAALGAPLGKFAGRYLVRGGAQEVPEGKARPRTVVIEFPSYDAAHACYFSPDYQAVKKLRDGNAAVDLVVVEGHGGAKF